LEGGTIYGASAEDGKANNSVRNSDIALAVWGDGTAKWGTGGTYTKGGVSQTGGNDIGSTGDTLIAIHAQ
jgi:hypothetical protein